MALHILLVEDDADLRREISEYLKRRRFEVTTLGSCKEASQFLSSAPLQPDVVLCDINLGDGDGMAIYAEFSTRRPACRWILMSGDLDGQRLANLNRRQPALPPCTIIDKPISLRRLVTIIAGNISD